MVGSSVSDVMISDTRRLAIRAQLIVDADEKSRDRSASVPSRVRRV